MSPGSKTRSYIQAIGTELIGNISVRQNTKPIQIAVPFEIQRFHQEPATSCGNAGRCGWLHLTEFPYKTSPIVGRRPLQLHQDKECLDSPPALQQSSSPPFSFRWRSSKTVTKKMSVLENKKPGKSIQGNEDIRHAAILDPRCWNRSTWRVSVEGREENHSVLRARGSEGHWQEGEETARRGVPREVEGRG